MSRLIVPVAVVLILAAGAACFVSKPEAQGIISGKVTVGPLCPVEPCPSPQPNPYSSLELVLQPKVGSSIFVKLNANGSFQAEAPAGTYSLDIANCKFLGCKYALPKTVIVEADKTTAVTIDIDTGIR